LGSTLTTCRFPASAQWIAAKADWQLPGTRVEIALTSSARGYVLVGQTVTMRGPNMMILARRPLIRVAMFVVAIAQTAMAQSPLEAYTVRRGAIIGTGDRIDGAHRGDYRSQAWEDQCLRNRGDA